MHSPNGAMPLSRATAKGRSSAAGSSEHQLDGGTDSFSWQAHSFIALVIVVCGLICVTFTPLDFVYRGAIAVVVVFILIGVIHLPNGPFVRPHPVLWRLVLCLSILYVLMLIFMLFQSMDDIQQFLNYFDPELGKPLPERSYAEDCRIYTPENPNGSFVNVVDKFDVFVPCHLIGWWVKTLIFRDFWLLTAGSIGFELLEYTLECQLPNFGECWWDHWVLDFVICNGLGIWLGLKTCEYLERKTYKWYELWKIPTLRGKLERVIYQFTPYSWTSFHWGYSSSLRRFLIVSAMTVLWMVQELNTFYLKAVLWVPANHNLNLYRESLYALCGSCAIKEIYDYLQSSDPNSRIGPFTWLTVMCISVEIALEIKFGWDIITIPVPFHVKLVWGTFLSVFLLGTYWYFHCSQSKCLDNQNKSKDE